MGACMLLGCTTLSGDLAKAGELYRDAYYEAAEVWLREVEPRAGELTAADRARFYYLRGMSAYRLQQRDDARHYLVLCREVLLTRGVTLERQAAAALERALEDLLQPLS